MKYDGVIVEMVLCCKHDTCDKDCSAKKAHVRDDNCEVSEGSSCGECVSIDELYPMKVVPNAGI